MLALLRKRGIVKITLQYLLPGTFSNKAVRTRSELESSSLKDAALCEKIISGFFSFKSEDFSTTAKEIYSFSLEADNHPGKEAVDVDCAVRLDILTRSRC